LYYSRSAADEEMVVMYSTQKWKWRHKKRIQMGQSPKHEMDYIDDEGAKTDAMNESGTVDVETMGCLVVGSIINPKSRCRVQFS
jgi:hypothetical protein